MIHTLWHFVTTDRRAYPLALDLILMGLFVALLVSDWRLKDAHRMPFIEWDGVEK